MVGGSVKALKRLVDAVGGCWLMVGGCVP